VRYLGDSTPDPNRRVAPTGVGEQGERQMEEPVADGTRERVARWIEEGETLFGLLPRLLDENAHLRAGAAAATRECEELRVEVAALRSENQQFRGERDEVTQTFSKLMTEMLQLPEEIVQKLPVRPRKSPFERVLAPDGTPRGGGAPAGK
jgi:hypothetical protein